MARNITVGIDIGTYEVKVVVTEAAQKGERAFPRILGYGIAETRGIRRGYIINPSEAIRSIAQAIRQAEKQSNMKIRRAYLALGGVGLQSVVSSGSIMISRADSEITELDVNKAVVASEKEIPKAFILNRKVIHTIPTQYKIDGKPVLGRPHGMKAMKLEAKTLFITCLEQHINDIIQCLEEIGIDVEDIIASPIAASLVTVSKIQKMAGCVVANIGSETVSLIVYESNLPISLEILPIGSSDITNDIALGLKIPLEEAEEVKRERSNPSSYSKKKVDEIIDARLSDIFELIEMHLKKISRSGLLPAGIIFVGGGSSLSGLEEFAKGALRLPAKVSPLELHGTQKPPERSIVFAVSYGLCILGGANGEEDSIGLDKGLALAKNTTKGIISWIKQFLP